jgi:hypothetical protein
LTFFSTCVSASSWMRSRLSLSIFFRAKARVGHLIAIDLQYISSLSIGFY